MNKKEQQSLFQSIDWEKVYQVSGDILVKAVLLLQLLQFIGVIK